MDSITLENFRCFRKRQTARLAPLTLLVGENSTGKTSFLALIRALWDVAYRQRIPDFNEDPYDLGSFDEISYHGSDSPPAESFRAGFHTTPIIRSNNSPPYYFEAMFEKQGTIPIPVERSLSQGDISVKETLGKTQMDIMLETERGNWQYYPPTADRFLDILNMEDRLYPLYSLFNRPWSSDRTKNLISPPNSPEPTDQDWSEIRKMSRSFVVPYLRRRQQGPNYYASAPVRSKPQRTYDPSRPFRDPEGDYVPMYLADLYSRHSELWEELKEQLEKFGQRSGLFDQISIKQLDGPFQIQVSKYSKTQKDLQDDLIDDSQRNLYPQRNLIDVGYGVSQILPLITELHRIDAPDMFLLQQPEVHLHPRAQAALGSLFCQVAGQNKQLVIETHSDFIIDRVRMEVRDGESSLKPKDVSLLFFEPGDPDVRIHSLRFDEEGNVLGTPPGYRKFFMNEVRKSIGL